MLGPLVGAQRSTTLSGQYDSTRVFQLICHIHIYVCVSCGMCMQVLKSGLAAAKAAQHAQAVTYVTQLLYASGYYLYRKREAGEQGGD